MNKALWVILVIILVVGGYFLFTNNNGDDQNEAMTENPGSMMEPVSVPLSAQNDSGQTGIATVTEANGQVEVAIDITSGQADVPQPAHIHTGTCEDLGGVVYPLTNVVNGMSETMLSVSLADLQAQGDLAINVHLSEEDASVYVACGNLSSLLMMEEDDGAMMEDEGQAQTVTVSMTDSGFEPSEVTVNRGDTVMFVNNGTTLHWPASAPHPTHTDLAGFDPRVGVEVGASWSFTFDQAGTWPFHDHLFPTRFGRVIVE